MIKKISMFVLCILISAAMSFTAYAANDTIPATQQPTNVIVRDITYSEAVEIIAEKNNISVGEAVELMGTRADGTFMREVIQNFDVGNDAVVEVGAIYEVWYGGSFRQINRLVNAWSALISEVTTADYDQIAITDMVISYPTQDGHVRARGTISHTITKSQESSIGVQLEILGFTVSSSTSTTITYRKTQNMDLHFHLYST